MELFWRIGRHPNVMPLRAYYYSKDEKLLVYNYMTGGSLFALLHGTFYVDPLSFFASLVHALASSISHENGQNLLSFVHHSATALDLFSYLM